MIAPFLIDMELFHLVVEDLFMYYRSKSLNLGLNRGATDLKLIYNFVASLHACCIEAALDRYSLHNIYRVKTLHRYLTEHDVVSARDFSFIRGADGSLQMPVMPGLYNVLRNCLLDLMAIQHHKDRICEVADKAINNVPLDSDEETILQDTLNELETREECVVLFYRTEFSQEDKDLFQRFLQFVDLNERLEYITEGINTLLWHATE
nr:hypothetical protein BgiMline_005185 [Biomphalaria glabrata]